MKYSNSIIKFNTAKKAILGYKWPMLFVITLITSLSIFTVLLNDKGERNDNFYIDSLKINSILQKEQKELELRIIKLNADTQEEIISEIRSEFEDKIISQIEELYNQKMNSKVEREFSRFIRQDIEFYIVENRVLVPKSQSTRSITISTNISSPLYFYKTEFLEQVRIFQSFQSSIKNIQSQVNQCYDGSFDRNICSQRVIEELLGGSNELQDITCLQTQRGLDCFFKVVPFTQFEFQVSSIPRQEDRRTIEISPNLILWNRNGNLEIDTNILFSNEQQLENYFMFLVPDSNYDIPSTINSFEEIFKQSLNEGEDNLNHISFEKIEEIFEDYITNSNPNSRSYKIELPQTPPIYLRIVSNYRFLSNNELEYIPMSQIISETQFPSDLPHSIFITRNRYFQDTSMYSRGTILITPPRPTQNPHAQ